MDDRDLQSSGDEDSEARDDEEELRRSQSGASSHSQNTSNQDYDRQSIAEDGSGADDGAADGNDSDDEERRSRESGAISYSRHSSRDEYDPQSIAEDDDDGAQLSVVGGDDDDAGMESDVEELQTRSDRTASHSMAERDRQSSTDQRESESGGEELRKSATRASSAHSYSADDRDHQSRADDEGDERNDGELQTRKSGASSVENSSGERYSEADGAGEGGSDTEERYDAQESGASSSSSQNDGIEDHGRPSSAEDQYGDDKNGFDSLERLFDWFSDDPYGQSMTYNAFNRLRRCTGEPMVAEHDWLRALAVVEEQHPEHGVSKANFGALSFGPPPCFGRYEDIGHAIETAASHCLAAQAFVMRFGVIANDEKGTKIIGLPQLQYLQQVLSVGFAIEEMQWREMLMLVRPYEAHEGGLDWTTFAEVCAAPFFRGRVFGSLPGTLASIESTLIDRQGAGSRDDIQDVDDFVTTRTEKAVALTPAISLETTRGQVLTYEMSCTDTGDIGIGLQSFSLGHCLVVASVTGQSAKYGQVIQPGDIVTRIDEEVIVYDRVSSSENETKERLNAARWLLQPRNRGQRRIRFHRPAATFLCASETKQLSVTFKTIADIGRSRTVVVQLPSPHLPWCLGNPSVPLTATWTSKPQGELLGAVSVRLCASTQSVVVILSEQSEIAANSTIELCIAGLTFQKTGKNHVLAGLGETFVEIVPTGLGEPESAHIIRLSASWTALASKSKDATIYSKKSHEEFFEYRHLDFPAGDSGVSWSTWPCYGPLAVVDSVMPSSRAEGLEVEPLDVLSSITVVDPEDGSRTVVDCLKPISAPSHLSDVCTFLEGIISKGLGYQLEFLRSRALLSYANERCIVVLRTPERPRRGGLEINLKMPTSKQCGVWVSAAPVRATVLFPLNALTVKHVNWNTAKDEVELTLSVNDPSGVATKTRLVIDIEGLVFTSGDSKDQSEAGCVSFAGNCTFTRFGGRGGDDNNTSTTPPRVQCTFHDGFESLPFAAKCLDASRALISPTADLSDDSAQRDDGNESIAGVNHLISLVKGDNKQLDDAEWLAQCGQVGADGEIGWDHHQFVTWWGVENDPKKTFFELQTAESLFGQLQRIYCGGEDKEELLPVESLPFIARALQIPSHQVQAAVVDLHRIGSEGWDCDTFTQVVWGSHHSVKCQRKAETDASPVVELWNYFQDAQKLFETFADTERHVLHRSAFEQLWVTQRPSGTQFTDEEWRSICEAGGVANTDAAESKHELTLGEFLAVCADNKLASRSNLLREWSPVRILQASAKMEQLEVDGDIRDNESRSVEQGLAPERVNIVEVAAKSLKDTATTENAMQDLMREGLEFGESEAVVVVDRTAEFGLKTSFAATKRLRTQGTLYIDLKSISELAGDILPSNVKDDSKSRTDRSSSFEGSHHEDDIDAAAESSDGAFDRKHTPNDSSDSVAEGEKLFVVFEITRSRGEQQDLKERPTSWRDHARRLLFGDFQLSQAKDDASREKQIVWDGGKSQELLRAGQASTDLQQVHSSLRSASEVRDGVLRYPEDLFSLEIGANRDTTTGEKDEPQYIVCRLFKRVICANETANPLAAELEELETKLLQLRERLDASRDRQGGDQDDDGLQREVESTQARVDQLRGEVDNANTDTELLGQASIELDALLSVLDGDSKSIEDLAMLRSENQQDVGVLLVGFQFKSDHRRRDESTTWAECLPSLPVTVDYPDENDRGDERKEQMAYEYPPMDPLELSWELNEKLQQGDRMYLVREDVKSKFTYPFFLLLWWSSATPQRQGDQAAPGEWWAPNAFRAAFASSGGISTAADASTTLKRTDQEGVVRFPSSLALSLPPGIYRVYLMRCAKNASSVTRTILGCSELLAVVPGVNSVHTCFGTTPLIDVRTLAVSLHAGTDTNHLLSPSSSTNPQQVAIANGDSPSRDALTIDQELEVATLDCDAATSEASRATQVPPALVMKIAQLRKIVESLREERRQLVDESGHDSNHDVLRAGGTQQAHVFMRNMKLTSGDYATIGFQVEGGTPMPGDSIVLMPSEVARMADMLRASILGKLQENDPRELEEVRLELEQRLQDVQRRLEVYRRRFYVWQWKRSWRELWWTARSLIPRIGAGAVLADGEPKQACWVLHECWRSYTDAPTIAKRCFPYVIRELVCEIRARRKDLGITEDGSGSKWETNVLEGSGKNSRSVVLEIPIPPVVAHIRPADDMQSEYAASGAVSVMLTPSIFWGGGRYVAKYVRRSSGSSDDETAAATAGELGRSSAFVVHRHEMVWTLVNTSVLLRHHWKSLRHVFVSRHFRLFTKLVLHAVVCFLRYTLTVVSLSFNITMVSINFNFKFDKVEKLLAYFRERLDWSVWRFVSWFKLDGILDWLKRVLHFLDIKLFLVEYECISGVLLYVFLVMLVGAAFLMYVVVRADLLLKLQKWHTMLDIPLNKSTISFCEQVGTLLVVPFYLTVKSVVLYMASSLSGFFWYTYQKPTSLTLTELKLFTTTTAKCPNLMLARFNVFAGFVALMLVITFVFLCLPLLVLDLYTWAPLPPPRKLKDATKAAGKRANHTNAKSSATGIRTAVQQGEFLVQWNLLSRISRTVASLPWVGPKWRASTLAVGNTRRRFAQWCTSRMPPTVAVVWQHPMFQDYEDMYSDFYVFSRDQIVAKYGLVGAAWIFFRVYFHLMVQSIVRGVGDLAWWRLSHEDMYPTSQMQPTSRQWWKRCNRMCLRFNVVWKIRYMLHRMLQPLFNVMLITLGIWGEYQWQTFQVEERANEAFSMEPSGEARQLQLMALQGKVVSLFWLCFPRTTFFSIFAEILNTGPLLTYFFNPKFLQADIPETEREAKPRWRLHKWTKRKNDPDVFFLWEHTTLFVVTALKGASALGQVVTLLSVYWPWRANPINAYRSLLVAAAVTPVLEFTHAAIASYLDYVEQVETTNATMTSVDDSSAATRSDNAVDETNGTDTNKDKGSLDTAYKAKKDLIVLDAMPRVSYVVLADALDDHEGELTISWQVNASQRYHKHDAIGMFPVRAPGDMTRRTMSDCICYRLLEETQSEQFGWYEARKRAAMESKAVDTRDQRIPLQALRTAASSESTTAHEKEIEVVIQETDDAVADVHASPPQQSQQRQVRERSTPNPMLAKQGRSTSKVFQITREARKIVNGQVKFRPVNNCVAEDDPNFERFTYGNDAGIYQAKYGLHAYEFCYLRYYDDGTRVSDNNKRRSSGKKHGKKEFVVQPILAGSSTRELPVGDAATASYEVLGQFLSNPIQIGTFNIYMSLTCAQPLVRANDRLDLSWTINGVPYSILSDPKTRNCIGFFKVSDSASATSASGAQHCARIEMLPSSAFLEACDDKPCTGRVTVKTPREPGLYEIRFLLNYFKASQLHRLCQVFGDLEDEMQQLRIRSVYEQRAVVDALRGFAALEHTTWRDARSATRLWLSSMLRSALRELENETLVSSQGRVSKPTAILVQAFKTKLHVAQTTTATSSSVFARTLAQMTKPFGLSSFYDVLVAAYESNSQLEDQLASITFMSPTENDKKTRNEPANVERYQLFVPRSDCNILKYGDYAFEFEAESYLSTRSLCGFVDFLDDLLLNHKQLLENLEQIVTSVSSSCVSLYEDAVLGALKDVEAEATSRGVAETLASARVMLLHTALNHVQTLISEFLERDKHTGLPWPGPFDEQMKKMASLRAGSSAPASDSTSTATEPLSLWARTPQYMALRVWAHPRLSRKIVNVLRIRHTRIVQSLWRCTRQLLCKTGLSLLMGIDDLIRSVQSPPKLEDPQLKQEAPSAQKADAGNENAPKNGHNK